MIQLSLWDEAPAQETFDPFTKIVPYRGTCTCWQHGYRVKCPACQQHEDDQDEAQDAYLKSQAFKDLEEEMFSKYPKIREIVESARRERQARETTLERLRRQNPDLSKEESLNCLLLGMLRIIQPRKGSRP